MGKLCVVISDGECGLKFDSQSFAANGTGTTAEADGTVSSYTLDCLVVIRVYLGRRGKPGLPVNYSPEHSFNADC